jgi:hypothetical protein
MIEINYCNADSGSGKEDFIHRLLKFIIIIFLGHIDNSGIRLYVGNELRQYDLGGLKFGVDSLPSSLAIPSKVDGFSVDSYCTADAGLYVCFRSL